MQDLKEEDKITFCGKLRITNEEDRSIIDLLMCKQSSCTRTSLNRLNENYKRNQLKRDFQPVFGLNSRYTDDAIYQTQSLIKSCNELGQDPQKVIFGGNKLFQKLQKRHLDQQKRIELKQLFIDKRSGNLYSRGDVSKNGNPNIKLEAEDAELILRINVGDNLWKKYPLEIDHEKIHELYIAALLVREPYTVRVQRRKNEYLVQITIDEHYPEPFHWKGVIGVDLNAFPSHIAWAEANDEGNLLQRGNIMTPELFDQRSNKRDYYEWIAAHKLIQIAIDNKKGLCFEKLKIPPMKKGKGTKKTRRKINNFPWKGICEKTIIVAKRAGIPVYQEYAAYSSMIGALKYAPMFDMSGHQGAAFVMARRAMGFIDEVPAHLLRLVEAHQMEELKKIEEAKEKKKLAKQKLVDENFNCLPSKERQLQGKRKQTVNRKAIGTRLGRKSLAVWSVVKAAALTAHATGGNVVKDKLSRKRKIYLSQINPSTWRKLIFREGLGNDAREIRDG